MSELRLLSGMKATAVVHDAPQVQILLHGGLIYLHNANYYTPYCWYPASAPTNSHVITLTNCFDLSLMV